MNLIVGYLHVGPRLVVLSRGDSRQGNGSISGVGDPESIQVDGDSGGGACSPGNRLRAGRGGYAIRERGLAALAGDPVLFVEPASQIEELAVGRTERSRGKAIRHLLLDPALWALDTHPAMVPQRTFTSFGCGTRAQSPHLEVRGRDGHGQVGLHANRAKRDQGRELTRIPCQLDSGGSPDASVALRLVDSVAPLQNLLCGAGSPLHRTRCCSSTAAGFRESAPLRGKRTSLIIRQGSITWPTRFGECYGPPSESTIRPIPRREFVNVSLAIEADCPP